MAFQGHVSSRISHLTYRSTANMMQSTLGLQVIRGTAAAPLSQLLTALEPQLRSAAGLSAWQVISPAHGSAAGRLEVAAQLRDVQHSRYMEPTVLLVDRVGGDEEVPEVSQTQKSSHRRIS